MRRPPPLRDIPVVEAADPAAAVAALPEQVADLLRGAWWRYTPLGLALGDAVSRRWLARNGNPYLPEIEAVARRIGRPGAHLLNVSYEWACTTGVRIGAGDGRPPLMLRVLDWALPRLGRNLAVLRRRGPAGEWLDLGWPGLVGSFTGLAPGRFAAAINQPPPLARSRLGMPGDWVATHPAVWRSRALPPAHLLRRAFDEAAHFEAAMDLLCATPISAPALFVLAGTGPAEACVVERLPEGARVRRGFAAPIVAANHWVATPDQPGRPRGRHSESRQGRMEAALRATADADLFGLAWLRPPVLNRDTRLAAVIEPATGRLALQGFERDGAATRPLVLPA